jgi:type IV pilus assembly protein PilA
MKTLQKGFTLIELMIVVAIIGILAAVAIPSYQDYTARAQVAEGLQLTSQFKTTLAEFYADNGDYAGSGVNLTDLGGTTTGKYVDFITLENVATSTITVTATFKTTGVAAAIKGSQFAIATIDGGKSWVCGQLAVDATVGGTGTPIDTKYNPGACK